MTRLCTVSAFAIAIAIAACSKDMLPNTPSQLTDGVVIYTHANYLGDSAHVVTDISDLADFEGPCRGGDPNGTEGDATWDDCVSSIRIAPGWRATVYRDRNYSGTSLVVTGDVPNLQLVQGNCSHEGMNDCITAIRLSPP
jgi:hypothetical protein